MPEVAIIIVNTNTRDWLHQCLLSLRDNDDVEREVVVIENDSEDSSREMLQEEFPEVKVIVNEEKFGFAYNNNLGAKASTAPVLLFLNPDTKVPPGSLRHMLNAIEHRPDMGVFGGKIFDGKDGIERSTGKFPTLTSIFLDRILGYAPPLHPLLQRFSQRHYSGYETARSVDWVTGADLWIRRQLFESVGGWDSAIFLYYEDQDLCYKVKRAGYGVFYTPTSTIYHYHNQTPMTSDYRKGLMRKGLHIFIRKHYGPVRCWLYKKVLRLPDIDPGEAEKK